MRRALPTAVLLLLALAGVAHADLPWLANNRAAGFQLDGLHAPQTSKDPSTAALRLGDVAICAGIPWSIGVNGAFRCSADGSDYLSPTTGLPLGGHAGFSVIGRSATGTGAAADIIPSGTPPIVLTWDGSSTSFKPVTPASSGGVATWSLTGVRVFAVNPSGGSDTNQCWTDSADATQANVAAATVTAWAKACATLGGAAAEIPPQLAGRAAYVDVEGNGTTYADPWTVFDRTGGTVVIYVTGTNSTCGATAGTGTTADYICQGAVTAAGMNAAGYHPATSGTSQLLQLVKAAGGSPAFGAEPGKPLMVRFRGDSGNGTTATRNHVNSVVAVTAADTIQLDAAITYTTADTFYLEDPGATAPGGTFMANGTVVVAGIQASSFVQFAGQTTVEVAFSQFPSSGLITNLPSGTTFVITVLPITSFSTIGPSRAQRFSASGGTPEFVGASFATVSNFTVTNPTEMSFGDYNVVGGNATIIGGATETAIGAQFGGITGPTLSARVLGKLILSGARVALGYISLPSTSQAFGITISGTNDVNFSGRIAGGTKTNAGIDASLSINSRFAYASPTTDDSTIGLTVTGTNGDIYYGTQNNIGSAPIYQSYDGFAVVDGTVVLNNGDRWSNWTRSGNKIYGNAQAASCHNDSGSDIPSGSVVRFGNIGDQRDCAIAEADTFAHSTGTLGVSLGVIKNGNAGFVGMSGTMGVTWSDVVGGSPGAGGWPAYLSDTVAGQVRHTPPSGGTTVARQLAWATTENEVLMLPDNWAVGGGIEFGGSVNPGGLSPATGGLIQRSAMTMSGAVVGTFAAGSNTATTTFGAAPALAGLFNTTTGSAVPTWLACTGAGQVIQDTGTAMACAALAFTSLTSVPNFLLDPGGNGLAVRTASGVTTNRTLTSSGATITVTNGSGVAGNPNVDLPTQGTGPGSCTNCSVTFDAQGRETVYTSGATPALASTTVQGTAPINIAGDHATHDLSTNRVWALDANGVTNSFLAQMGAGTIKGNNAGSLANAADLTATQVTAMLNPFTSSLQGLAPSSGGGSSNFLRADGTWTVPPGTGVPTTRTLTMTAPMTCDAGSSCDLSANRTIATPVFVASGASHAPGLVPDPGSSAGTTRFLREDATWQTVTSGGTITLSGDATGSGTTSITVTNVNLPNGVTQAGLLNIAETAAPATPAAGHVDFFADSTQHNGAFKNSSGTLTYGAQVDSGASHHFLQTFAATGAFTDAQPVIGDLGSIAANTLVANTGSGSAAPTTLSLGSTSGIMEYVNGSPDTLTAFASGSQRIPFGSGTSGQFTDSASFTYDGSEEIIGTAGTQSVNFPFFGTLSAGTSIKFNTSINQGIVKTAGSSLYIGTAAGGSDIVYFTNGVGVMDIDATQRFNWGGSVEHAAGLTMQEWINTPPSTASAASLGPVHDFRPITITLTGTTHNTSAKGHVYFEAPTITDASAVTVDDFPTVGISGGPIAAGSVTLTLAPALEIFSGAIQIDALSAGGMLKTDTHGDVVLATAGTNYSAGTAALATAPLCNTTGTGALSACALGSGLTYSGSVLNEVLGSTASTLGNTSALIQTVAIDAYGKLTGGSIVTAGPGITISSGSISARETIDFTTLLIFSGAGTPAGWLGTASTTPGLGQIGQTYEYPKLFAANTATLTTVVVHNNMDGSGDVAINVTRNGSTIGSTAHILTTTSPGTVITIGPISVSGGASTDTYGVEWNSSGIVTNGKEIDATSTLVLQ